MSSFTVENYRAFARRQEIVIRPLTLFFGWNSGGKSALVRFLPLLAESLRMAGPPIWLGGDVGRGATWPELVCKATERNVLRFGLTFFNGFRADWEVRGDLEGRWQEITSLTLTQGGEPQVIEGIDSSAGLFTGGLLPALRAAPSAGVLWTALQGLTQDIQWVNGLRARPPRLFMYGGGATPRLSPDGQDAVTHLIAAQLRSSADPLLLETQRFFTALGEQLVLDSPIVGAWWVRLQPKNAPLVSVDLCDTGEGYAQVLPVLVALARAKVGGPRLLCLEQPELHLHTRAQAELAMLLVDAAKQKEQQVLVETHSEVLLSSVQLAIATGALEPEQVQVYWVESRADGTSDALPVQFDKQGRPTDTTLIGAFDDAIQLGQKLVTAQLGMGRR